MEEHSLIYMTNLYDGAMDLSTKLQQRIDTAIDYINSNSYESGDTSSMCLVDIEELLKILKGENTKE